MRKIGQLIPRSIKIRIGGLMLDIKAWLAHYDAKKCMSIYYKASLHKDMNWDNPTNLIEKINWLQLNSDTTLWTKCADKYRVREYLKEKGCGNYLNELYGVWDKAEEVDFESLPNQFVLKANHGCGEVMVVKDKSTLNIEQTRKKMSKWLKDNYGKKSGQTHYTRIKPCIIAEELLVQSEELNSFSPKSLVDYKVWCFGGEPESIFVAYNRHNTLMVNMALYDTKWKPIPQYLRDTDLEKYNPNVSIPKPDCLEEMLEIARKLTKPFPEVRLDFYIINGKPYIGEMTFTSGYGYFTDDYYEYLGSKVNLCNKDNHNACIHK